MNYPSNILESASLLSSFGRNDALSMLSQVRIWGHFGGKMSCGVKDEVEMSEVKMLILREHLAYLLMTTDRSRNSSKHLFGT